jgi:hypothetical protein
MKIVLHIERLVLEGLADGTVSRRDLPEVVQAELVRLLTVAPVKPASAVWREAPAAAPRGDHGAPAGVGQAIARAVHGALGAAR